MFEVTVATGSAEVVVDAYGEIDVLAAPELRRALAEAVREAGVGPIVVDLSQVRFLDSTGVQALLDGYHSAMVAGGTLTLRGARGTVARVLEIVGLARMFGVPSAGDGPTLPHQFERPG